MPAWPINYDSPVITDTPLVTTAETVIATLSNVSVPGPGARVKLSGFAQITGGTAVTALTLRVRRGTLITDTLVGEGDPISGGVAAASTTSLSLDVTDTPPEIAGATYILTAQQTTASGNASVVQAGLKATIN